MGVAWVFLSDQTIPEIKANLDQHGATEIGTYNVEMHQIVPNEKLKGTERNGMSTNYVIHHDEYPANSFIYQVSSKDSSKFNKVTSLRGIDALYTKYEDSVEYNPEGAMIISGKTYQLEDNIIRVGTASCRSSCCGTVIELEVTPCFNLSGCYVFMKEVIAAVFPKEYPTIHKPRLFDSIGKEKYIPSYTMMQYMSIFDILRSKVVV
uniref:Mediator of RNA polymerase II transcription subunit 20 n=1 Tax=Parastrongyloides trichosuri TaxID=131310 RepID=A0A0N5A5D9_PARTI